MVNSTSLLKSLPIGTSRTLIRWHQAGLIPPPSVTTHPSGRGKMSYWPDWIVDRCRRILDMKKQGYTLTAIRDALGSDWQSEEKAWNARQNRSSGLKVVSTSISKLTAKLRRRIAEATWKRVCLSTNQPVLPGTQLHRSFVLPLIETDLLEIAFIDAVRGFRVFLLYDGAAVSIVRDVDIGVRLGMASDRGVFVVIPVLAELRSVAAELSIEMPPHPLMLPCHEFEHEHNGRAERKKFRIAGDCEVIVQSDTVPNVSDSTSDAPILSTMTTERPRRVVIRGQRRDTDAEHDGK